MRALIALLLVYAIPAAAETLPHPGPGDPRIQYVDFDPNQVVVLNATPGFAITVELSPEERIENIALGNGNAWQVQVNRRSDKIFVKPLQIGISTNLTVITDARRYSFSLRSGEANNQLTPFSVRFTYPAPAITGNQTALEKVASYKLSGKRALRPTDMFDDGQFTTIIWSPETTMPAVYKVDDQRRETLVNGAVRNGAYVVEGVASDFVFRLGKDMARATRVPLKEAR